MERAEAVGQSPLERWAASFVALVGADVIRELASFSREAGPGSMITIRCNRDGFTAQVTGPIVGGRSQLMTPEAIFVMETELD